MNILGVIPARYASTRFPAKALADINGKPMIQCVYEQCLESTMLSDVIVATDDNRIKDVIEKAGGKAMLTSEDHNSGTDRCAEIVSNFPDVDYIINIQGDEPFINPEQIDQLCAILNSNVEIGTLIKLIDSQEELFDVNIPKVVFNTSLEAIYFSRNTIPFSRGTDKDAWINEHKYYKHIGMYAYRKDVLQKIAGIEPSDLELAESLEQLRWLENGFKINLKITEFDSIGIDTPEDLERALAGKR